MEGTFALSPVRVFEAIPGERQENAVFISLHTSKTALEV